MCGVVRSTPAGRTILDFSDGLPSSVNEHFSLVGSAFGSGSANLTAASSTWASTTLAGPTSIVTPPAGTSAVFADGTGTNAAFNHMGGGAVDLQGNVYLADVGFYRIRKVTPLGVVSTFAGSGCCSGGNAPDVNVPATSATFGSPQDVAFDPTNNFLYIAEAYQQKLRVVNMSSGNITTLAGAFNSAYVDGLGTNARFQNLNALAVDTNATSPRYGCIYLTEGVGCRVRRICDPLGVANVTTIAGGGGTSSCGYSDGLGTNALFNSFRGIGIDPSGRYLCGISRRAWLASSTRSHRNFSH